MRLLTDSHSRQRLTRILLVALGLAPMLLMVHTVVRLWLPLPYWDEWSTPGANLVDLSLGKLTFEELFSQHNESRKLFPRLLYLGLAQLGGWDVRKEMSLIIVIVAASAFLFYRLLRGTPHATTLTALIAWAAGMFLFFSPVQLENFLWGVQLEVFFPGFALLAIIAINLSQFSLGQKALLNGCLAFIATFTVAHGMLLWLLGIPLPARGSPLSWRRILLVHLPYLMCAALSLTAYFVGYARPAHHPPFLAGHPGPFTLAHYLILWVGSYFNSSLVDPFAVGLAAILLLASALGVSLWVIGRGADWRTFYAPFLITAYVCATAGITVMGRIGFGVQQALDTRYRPYSVFFFLALVWLLFSLYCARFRHARKSRHIFLGICAAAALLALIGWVACQIDSAKVQDILRRQNLARLRALEWAEVIPDNPDLREIFPNQKALLDYSRILREHGFLRLDFPSAELVRLVQQEPQPRAGSSLGQIEKCFFDPQHNLHVAGRARLPERKEPPDCVVIGARGRDGAFKPFSVIETKRRRGGGKAAGPERARLAFGRAIESTNIPAGDILVEAWSIDLRNEKAYPLGGATFIWTAQR